MASTEVNFSKALQQLELEKPEKRLSIIKQVREKLSRQAAEAQEKLGASES